MQRMPPSPAIRCSPGRELKAENHKRGRSLEGGVLFREKDDDLALFNEVQSRERENFLLQSNDDFEDIFSTKLKYFSDYKLGISIPARGESSDLLNADGDKNDYDWLLTPPDTPLFPSLDDETPSVNHAQRGRPQSQPISISRSSTMEKSYRSSRGSASPNRLSPSPRSGNSPYQSRGRSSSAPQSSPPCLRPATPSRKPSPSPSKTSTPPPRSSTPTPRRMSTGSTRVAAPSRVRGTSPIKTSRGNSASPKIRAWQSNIPGFSLEAPPNLRTSLGERPASYVRGSSPASRNGSKSGRQSMSPTASRSVSSSHSHDRDRLSSHSKGSVASSGDDDVDSLQSIPLSSSDHSAPRITGALANNRTGYSKKATRTVSSSAPKRSFDLAIRHMDNRKGPQNMFRPLLSSVPSSTFYVGKANAANRAMMSRHSSVTTSSNASSDLATSGALDTEGSDHNQEDITSEYARTSHPDTQDDMFALDKVNDSNEDFGHELHDESPDIIHGEYDDQAAVGCQLVGTDGCSQNDISSAITSSSEFFDRKGDYPHADSVDDNVICSKCGCRFPLLETVEGDLKLCPECRSSVVSALSTTYLSTAVMTGENPLGTSAENLDHLSLDGFQTLATLPEPIESIAIDESESNQHQKYFNEGQNSCSQLRGNSSQEKSDAELLVEGEHDLVNQQISSQPTISASDADTSYRQEQLVSDSFDAKVDLSDGAGISVLLKRSSSGRGHIVQSRTFAATNINYDDFSYMRDSTNSMRSSFGHGSASASSSIDLGSARQIEVRVQRQLSGRKSDIENYRYEMNARHQRSVSSMSGASNHSVLALGLAVSSHDENFESSAAGKCVLDVTCADPEEQVLVSENTDVDNAFIYSNCETAPEISSHTMDVDFVDTPVTSVSNLGESVSSESGDHLAKSSSSAMDAEGPSTLPETCSLGENAMENASFDSAFNIDIPNQSSLDPISELEMENGQLGYLDSKSDASDAGSMNSKGSTNELPESPNPTDSGKCIPDSVKEHQSSDPSHHLLEESTVMLESEGGAKARSLTLEEATETILFCSSIVHDLAYAAANIAIEKESSAFLEGSRPTITIPDKPKSRGRDTHGRATTRHTSKSQKARQSTVEADSRHLPVNTENEEKIDISTTRIVGVPNKGDSMKPPKLESKCNCVIM